MVLWFAALVDARERDRAPPLWLAAVMALWANLQGGYMFGLVFAALFAGEALLAASDRAARLVVIKQWGTFGVVSLAASLLTPNGFAGWWLPFHLLSMKFALSVLVEWQSPNFQTVQPIEIWLVVALALALGFGVKLPLTRIAMLLLLLHMSLAHRRQAEVLGLIAPCSWRLPSARSSATGHGGTKPRRSMACSPIWRAARACAARSLLAWLPWRWRRSSRMRRWCASPTPIRHQPRSILPPLTI